VSKLLEENKEVKKEVNILKENRGIKGF